MGMRHYKHILAAKSGWNCHYCGCDLTNLDTVEDADSIKHHPDYPQCDHVTPKKNGGKTTIKNLVLSCRSCNRAKGSKSYEEFVRSLNDR